MWIQQMMADSTKWGPECMALYGVTPNRHDVWSHATFHMASTRYGTSWGQTAGDAIWSQCERCDSRSLSNRMWRQWHTLNSTHPEPEREWQRTSPHEEWPTNERRGRPAKIPNIGMGAQRDRAVVWCEVRVRLDDQPYETSVTHYC